MMFIFKLAIIENLRSLKYLLDQRLASVSDEVYMQILRDTLMHVCKCCQENVDFHLENIILVICSEQRKSTTFTNNR